MGFPVLCAKNFPLELDSGTVSKVPRPEGDTRTPSRLRGAKGAPGVMAGNAAREFQRLVISQRSIRFYHGLFQVQKRGWRIADGESHIANRPARRIGAARCDMRYAIQHSSQIHLTALSRSSVTIQMSRSSGETVRQVPACAVLIHSTRGVQNSVPMRITGTSRSALPV